MSGVAEAPSDADLAVILELLPELEEILDQSLRRAVAEIWVRAWRGSDWTRPEDCPKGIMLPDDSLVQHSRAVASLAIAIGRSLRGEWPTSLDEDALLAIALLHDVSRLREYEPAPQGGVQTSDVGRRYQHAFLGGVWAQECGLSADIVHAITVHTPESAVVPQTPEAMIVHYADFIHTDAIRLERGLELWAKRRSS